MRDDCRWLPNRNEQPQLVSATQPAGCGGRHGAVCGQEEKRQQVADDYISTAVANRGNYTKQAEEYFAEHVGINIPIPKLNNLPE